MKNNTLPLTFLVLSLAACSTSMTRDDSGWPINGSAPGSGSGKTYFVDGAGGDDSFSGTSENPFKTIGKASGLVKPGDTVIVKEGVYNEIVEVKTPGTFDAWISFVASPAGKVFVVSPDWWGGFDRPFDITANYIHVEGFDLTSTGTGGSGIAVRGTEKDPVHHIRIFNNNVHDNCGSGIGSGFADYLHIRGNTVYRNAWFSHYHESGINLWEGRAFDKKSGFHNIVECNISFDNDNLAPEIQNGVELPWDYTDGNGIIIDWCRDENTSTLVQNNICFNNGGRGIQITVSSNVTVINNTMYMNSMHEKSFGEFGSGGYDGSKGSHNIIARNNIMYARNNKPCTDLYSDRSTCVYDNNLYYNGTNNIAFDGWLNSPKGGIAGVLGTNNILNKDPLFAQTKPIDGVTANSREDHLLSNPAGYNFSLNAGSPAVNAGNAALLAETDFYGRTRINADMGAVAYYE